MVLIGALLAVPLAVVGDAPTSFAAETPVLVSSDAETEPVSHSGDAMDDPAVWVHPTDPERSLVIGNDKGGALDTYDLDGSLVQRLSFNGRFWGNVDVRQGVTIGGTTHDLVGAIQGGVRFYTVDPATRLLSSVTEGGGPIGANGEGFCMYQSPTSGRVYGYSITIAGSLTQFELLDADGDGLLESNTVRTFAVGSEAEGCVADDDTGALYISEENTALWRYDAEPGGGTTREAVDVLAAAGGHLLHDVEGVTLVDQADGGGYVIVSVQNSDNPNASYFSVYRRGAGNDFVNTFRIADGTASDDCDRTDGITAVTASLGPRFPRGAFICQDNNNDLPGSTGNQNLKLTRLERVVDLDGGAPPPPPPPDPSPLSFVGQATRNANSTAFAVTVPASVRAGDAMLLFASQNTTATPSGPGAGWTQIGRVVDGSHVSTVWRRTATDADAGGTVRLTTASYTKLGLTLAAYRGADPEDPVAAVVGAAEPGTTPAHTTPQVANSTPGAWRVSYWSDKTSAATGWTPPAGETVRATTAGSGGGRIGTLLTDPAAASTAGSPATTGGLTATSDAGTDTATMWTVLLRPAGDPPPNQPPTARFVVDCTGLACEVDASTSSDPDDGIVSYAWEFGDGASGDGRITDHTYDVAGSYTVRLTVTDDAGETDTTEQQVDVVAQPPPTEITFVGQATSNANSVAFAAGVPAAVQPGDLLVLFASQNTVTPLSGPGAGWTQFGRVDDSGHVTTGWWRVATASDAGSVVRLTSGATYTKVALTLAAYRGVSPTAPVAGVAGAPGPGTSAAHATPVVPNSTAGAWRVSYWSDKTSATTTWTGPAGEARRASTVGSGSGRIGALLTDSGQALTTGTPTTGGLVATTDAATDKATTWTLLLRPAG